MKAFFFLSINDNKTQSSAFFLMCENLRTLPWKRDKPYDANLNISFPFFGWKGVQGLKSWWITSSNLLVRIALLSANLHSLAMKWHGAMLTASWYRLPFKARTTESVNEQINIYTFPLANRYLICNFIIHGAARDCSQQDRRASSFRFALFSASVSASLLFPRTTKQADNLFFVLRAIDIAGAFQAWRIKGP